MKIIVFICLLVVCIHTMKTTDAWEFMESPILLMQYSHNTYQNLSLLVDYSKYVPTFLDAKKIRLL